MISDKIIVRKAKLSDAKSIWQIRNLPLVRSNSNNSKKIDFKSHQAWFENKYFKNRKNHCFVLEIDKNIQGYCRFDLDKDKYIVSIAINPASHGLGLGNILLSRALNLVKTKKEILAEIKQTNLSSINLFLKNNFQIFHQDEKIIYLKYQF